MAFNKIQPQQLQLPTFISHEGNLTFEDNVTGVTVELSPTINGSIDFADGITIGGRQIVQSSSSTDSSGEGLSAFSNSGILTLRGSYNAALGGLASSLGGERNVLINNQGGFAQGTATHSNTIIGGDAINLQNAITGSVGLFSANATEDMDENDVVYINGFNGVKVTSDSYFLDDAFFTRDLYVEDDVFVTGDLGVTGALRVTGESWFRDRVNFDKVTTSGRLYVRGSEGMIVDDNATFNGYSTFYSAGFSSNEVVEFSGQTNFNNFTQFKGETLLSGKTLLSGSSDKIISGGDIGFYSNVTFAGNVEIDGDLTVNGLGTVATTGWVTDFVTGGGNTRGDSFVVGTRPKQADIETVFISDLGIEIEGGILLNISGYHFYISGLWMRKSGYIDLTNETWESPALYHYPDIEYRQGEV